MSTIAKIAVSLEAQYAQFTEGIGSAGKSMDAAGKSGTGAAGGISSFFSSFAEGAGIGVGIELISAGFEMAEHAIEGATEKLGEWVSESMKGQQEAFRLAETLHMHVDTLEGLEAAGRRAGLGSEEMGMALEKTNHAIGEAAVKGGESSEAFTKLGLDARKLAGQSLDVSIRQMADALAAVKNPAEQAADAGALFGEKLGPKLLPLLQQGSAGIEAIIKQAKESGVALSDIDAAKVVAAQRGLDEIGERAEGAKNQLTVALAPSIIAVGEKLLGLLPPAEKIKAAATTAFQTIIVFSAEAADGIAHMLAPLMRVSAKMDELSSKATFGNLSKGLKAAAEMSNAAADKLENSNLSGKSMNWLAEIDAKSAKIASDMAANLSKPPVAMADSFNENGKKIADVLAHLTEAAATSGGQSKEIIDLQKMHATNAELEHAKNLIAQINQNKIHIEADKSLEDLAKQIAQFSMTAGQKTMDNALRAGAGPEALETARMYVNELDSLEKHKKDADDAKKLIEDSISPLDKYKTEIGHLKELKAEGLLNADQYGRAISKANKGLEDKLKDPNEDKKFGAETRRFNFQGPATGPQIADPIKQLADTTKKQADDIAQSNYYLSEMYRFARDADATPDEIVDF